MVRQSRWLVFAGIAIATGLAFSWVGVKIIRAATNDAAMAAGDKTSASPAAAMAVQPSTVAPRTNSERKDSPSNESQWPDVDDKKWTLSIALDMPTLDPQAVQYVIIEDIRLPDFAKKIKWAMKSRRLEPADVKDTTQKDGRRAIQMMECWDAGFNSMPGGEVRLLTKPAKKDGTIVIVSNLPPGKLRIATKTRNDGQGRPVCWLIPVDIKYGDRVDVVLNQDNAIDPRSAIDAVLSATDDAHQ